MKEFVIEVQAKMLVNVTAPNEPAALAILRERILASRGEAPGDPTEQCTLEIALKGGDGEIVQVQLADVAEAECFEK